MEYRKRKKQWMATLAGALHLCAPAIAADIPAKEKLAWSMLTLLGNEPPTTECKESVPVCAHIAELQAVRVAEPALVRGDLRNLPTDKAPHLIAFARRLPGGNRAPFIDTLVIFNMTPKPLSATVMIDRRIDVTKSLMGRCSMPSPGGLLEVRLAAYETLVCAGAVAVN